MTPVTSLEPFVCYAARTVNSRVLVCLLGVSLSGCRTASEPSEVGPEETPAAPSSGSALLLEDLSAAALYPPGNWWSRDIRDAPVDPRSDDMLQWIGVRPLHPDFGPPPFGIPYVTVSANTPRVPIAFVDYPEESDAGAPGRPGYPIPEEAKSEPNFIEGACLVAEATATAIFSSSIVTNSSYSRLGPHVSTPMRAAGKRAQGRCSI